MGWLLSQQIMSVEQQEGSFRSL